MKRLSIVIFTALFSMLANAQTLPPIGTIEVYGLHSLSETQVRNALQIKEGNSVTRSSKTEIEKRLVSLPGVAQSSVTVTCCDDIKRQSILYVSIREKGTLPFTYHPAPTGSIRLPAEIIRTGNNLDKAVEQAVLKNDATEDDSQGHTLFNNAEAHGLQLRFISFAAAHWPLLRRVLRESSNADDRARAVEIIAYYKDKRAVANELVYAVADADEGVRNNAMRALGVIAQFAIDKQRIDIKIPYAPFVKMLNSVEWTDRNKASWLLSRLTAGRDAKMLAALRREALPALIEMARWKNPGHAMMPFIILGRIAEISEDEIFQMWQKGDREAVIEKAQSLKF